MKKFHVVNSLRVVFLFCLLCISIRLVIDYEFSEPILLAFPLFFIGHLNPNILFSPSLFPYLPEEKELVSLIYPILINVIIWFPIRKAYHSIYGVIWVEKWKACFTMLRSLCILLLASLFGNGHIAGYFWGFLISVIYYIYLIYSFKIIESEEFLVKKQVDITRSKINLKKLLAVLCVHIIVFISLGMDDRIRMEKYEERLPEKEISIPINRIKGLSTNGENILLFYPPGGPPVMEEEEYAMGMFELKYGKLEKTKIMDNKGVLKFSKESKYIFIEDHNDEMLGGNLKADNIQNKNVVKIFEVKERKHPRIKKVGFSKNNSFFFETGRVCTIWDYKDEKRVVVYETEGSMYDLVWLNENQYIIIQKYQKSDCRLWEHDVEIMWSEILPDKSIKEKPKKGIASYIADKIEKVGINNMFIKGINELSICTVLGGKDKNGVFDYKSYIDFWDIETEKIFFSLHTGNEVLDVVVLNKENKFIVIERMKNQNVRVVFWNLKEKKKERVVVLKGMDYSIKKENIRVINGGTELLVLKNPGGIWSIN